MKIILALIFLTIINTYQCQEIKDIFEEINKKIKKFNGMAAEIAWESSVNPDDPDLAYKSAIFQKENIEWQQRTCEKLERLQIHRVFDSTQIRQMYLLCRGPKYTYDEARLASNLYEELQSIYTEAKACIPMERNISTNNLTEVETAILKYLKSADQRTYNWPDTTISAVQNAITVEGNKCLCLVEHDFQNLMAFSRNEEVLKWLWLLWRENVGPPMKEPYRKLVKIENVAARRNGYTDIGASWRDEQEMPSLRHTCRRLYEDIKPLYSLLHGVARFYLRREYGDVVPETGPIPAHLLGNLWSQNWEPIADLIIPKTIDLNQSITKLNWTVHHMIKRAEDFYQSLGLPPMTDSFWSKSVFMRNNNKTRCHGAAADMFKEGDFRLLYCSGTTIEDFYVLHHELGHIQYYMAYEHLPALFRQANTALHEAIGDTIMYGVMTPQHLHRLGLINDSLLYSTKIIQGTIDIKNENKLPEAEIHKKERRDIDDIDSLFNILTMEETIVNKNRNKLTNAENNKHKAIYDILYSTNAFTIEEPIKGSKYEFTEAEINKEERHDIYEELDITIDDILLLKQALNKIPQIPFSLVIDEYRWKYFEGGFTRFDVNEEFWQLSFELQGVAPPLERGDEFDIGAKFHVPDNTPYIRYFLSSFLQHQLFESICKAAVFGRRGVNDPLPNTIAMNRCDIYGSKTAGKLLKDIMSRGHSQHWREVLRETTGQDDISASALKRYYRPLYTVLEKLVRLHRIPIGW